MAEHDIAKDGTAGDGVADDGIRVSVPMAVMTTTVCLWVVIALVATLAFAAIRGGVTTDLHGLTVRGVAPFFAIGLFAQLVDGALGMGYGIISSVLLVGSGLPPAIASTNVHTVETFTTAASGIAHVRQGNVDWRLFLRLTLPGIVGGLLGALAISIAPVSVARPVVLGYLAVVGVLLLVRVAARGFRARRPRVIELLGLGGGFFDASGGGGWGPIVTGSMLLQGVEPRGVVGTIDLAEFFVTAVVAIFLTAAVGIPLVSSATVGLLLGGLVAAPVAARLARRLPARPMTMAIGALLTAIAGYELWVLAA